MENKEFYFTTGELARLTGLSKQLLIFYDKKNFFTATATGSNGYRYYLLSKYFQLKILITLRKMDIPLEEIYQYLQHGNDEFLLSIYKRKLSEYQEQMKQLQKKSQILEKRIQSMERQPHLILNRIFITELEKERRYYRWDIDMSAPVKDRVSHMAAVLRPYLQGRELLSRQHSRLHFTIVVPARETARHNLLLLDTLHPAHTWYKRASRIHHEAGHLSQSPWIWSLWCH